MKNIPVLYEDAEIMAVNKPAGIAVQGGQGVAHPLDELLAEQVGHKIFLVHRLDRDTAGILLVAKTAAAAAKYAAMLNGSAIQKTYTAFCFGKPLQNKGVIDLPINVKGEEKAAKTAYRSLETIMYPLEGGETVITRMELILDTGRMHQIRIHLAKSGLPIVADDKHGVFKLNRGFRKLCGVKILQLAATALVFPDCIGVRRELQIDLPPHMSAFWAVCRQCSRTNNRCSPAVLRDKTASAALEKADAEF